MPAKVITMGDFRGLLIDAIEKVRDGKMSAEQAGTIAKLAGAVTATLNAEAQAIAAVAKAKGTLPLGVGELKLCTPSAAPLPPAMAGRGGDPLPPPPEDDMVWCGQCEKRVSPQRAAECASPFCKAKGGAA